MNVSFYCKHCGKYLRKGNHSECKRILREQRDEKAEAKLVGLKGFTPETHRIALGHVQQRRYAAGDFDFLAGLDASCIPDES